MSAWITFIFNTNQEYRQEDLGTDVIADFNEVRGDKIPLDKRTFSVITSKKGDGFSVGSEFETVDSDAAAAVSDAVVVYNRTNGNLFYNPNGSNNGLGSGGSWQQDYTKTDVVVPVLRIAPVAIGAAAIPGDVLTQRTSMYPR